MRHLLAATILCAAAMPAEADPVVVELFTSQGCSSCPPADELLGQLAAREDVIALALHVDYWDYIGWADTFADAAHTERQYAYAHTAGTRVVYTPQMVIGGADHVVGYRPMEVMDLLGDHRGRDHRVQIRTDRDGDLWRIEIAAVDGAALPDTMVVHLVGYIGGETVAIRRGENAGETLSYHNVVVDWQVLGEWDGAGPFRTASAPPAGEAGAILVQTGTAGPIVGAARLP